MTQKYRATMYGTYIQWTYNLIIFQSPTVKIMQKYIIKNVPDLKRL